MGILRARTRFNLGRLYLARGEAQAALAQFVHALGDEPGFLPAHLGRIEALVALGRLGEAKTGIAQARRGVAALPPAQAHPIQSQLARLERLAAK